MRAVGNYLSNSQEFLKKFGKQLVDAAPEAFKKGIETAADKATKFSGDVYQNLKDGTYTYVMEIKLIVEEHLLVVQLAQFLML